MGASPPWRKSRILLLRIVSFGWAIVYSTTGGNSLKWDSRDHERKVSFHKCSPSWKEQVSSKDTWNLRAAKNSSHHLIQSVPAFGWWRAWRTETKRFGQHGTASGWPSWGQKWLLWMRGWNRLWGGFVAAPSEHAWIRAHFRQHYADLERLAQSRLGFKSALWDLACYLASLICVTG